MKSQLYRSQNNKVIGGVAGGLADYFDVDPVIIRVIFFVSMFAWGLSLLVYIGLWIFVPLDDSETEFYRPEVSDELKDAFEELGTNPSSDKTSYPQRKIIAGAILIIFGIIIMLDNFFPEIDMSHIWPILLICLGGYIIFRAKK